MIYKEKESLFEASVESTSCQFVVAAACTVEIVVVPAPQVLLMPDICVALDQLKAVPESGQTPLVRLVVQSG
ncbi:MAG: hypothetical protein WCA35_09885 [Kovacikia sp.]